MSDMIDFNNQTIEINPNQNQQSPDDKTQHNQNDTQTASAFNKIIEREVVVTDHNNVKIDISNEPTQTSSETINKTFIDKFFCCFAIFKKYFQITSNDFILRFINSFIPFNNKFGNLIKNNPDLYGPIWIYTSLIILLSATGSLTRTIQGHNNKNFFQEFIPIAGSTIYMVGFGLPILITILMKVFGIKLGFVHVICTYGYSFSIFLPISIICVIQYNYIQWIALIYAVFSSTSLLVVNYYKLMGDFSRNKKSIIIGIVLLAQIGLLLFFKLYFFRKFSDEVMEENVENDTVKKPNENKKFKPYIDDNIPETTFANFINATAMTNIITNAISSIIDTTMNLTINNTNSTNI
jgi:hypothetical protein